MRWAADIALPTRPPRRLDQPAGEFSFDVPRHRRFEFAADLFNHGYWWEAHEVWESEWQELGESPRKSLLRGLIQSAAWGLQLARGRVSTELGRRALKNLRGAGTGLRSTIDIEHLCAAIVCDGPLERAAEAWESAQVLPPKGSR